MRNSTKNILIGTALWLTAAGCWAADVRMSIEPELIGLLDRAVLKVEFIDTKGDAVDFPSTDGLSIEYRGPQTSYRFVNGRSTSSVIHTYVVTPAKVGDYTIGPVKVKYKGGEKELSTRLRVIKPKDDAEAQQLSEIMFSRITTDNPSPYVYEPFELKVKLHIRDGIQISESFALKGGLPDQGLDGELEWTVGRTGREEIGGIIYNTYALKATTKALTAGTFSFQPGVQVNVVVPRQNRRSYGFDDPFFGDFFGRQETRPIVLDCNRQDIEVRPIPLEGRPESYTGGVGKMDFDVTVGPTELKAGEPVTVKMRITGSGNLAKLMPPQLEGLTGIKLYDVRTVPTDNPNEVCYEQVLIPTSDTVTELPPIAFTYFNTQTADFRTITKGPFQLSVEAVPDQSAQVMTSRPAAPAATQVLGYDIAYLKTKPSRWVTAGDAAWHRTPRFRIMLVLPACIVAITGLIVARRSRFEQNEALVRRQKAPRAARQNIQRAGQAIKNGDAAAFYDAVWHTLTEYFGHRFNLASGEVTLQSVLERIPDEDHAIEQLFTITEQRRYGIDAGKSDPAEMKSMLRQLVALLKKCERIRR
jgi:hypothetical protein